MDIRIYSSTEQENAPTKQYKKHVMIKNMTKKMNCKLNEMKYYNQF